VRRSLQIPIGYGHSAVHPAAYRGAAELYDERFGFRHHYSRKTGKLLFEGIYAPKGPTCRRFWAATAARSRSPGRRHPNGRCCEASDTASLRDAIGIDEFDAVRARLE
jgi:hypothetical protein